MISEACAKIIKKNIDEIFALVFNGLQDEHARVRYQALACLGLILNDTSPDLQNKFHATLMPQLFKMMHGEELIKLKAQVVSTTCSFVNGLMHLEDDEETEVTPKQKEDAKTIIDLYSQALVENISALFNLAIEKQYAPLQEETLALLNNLAESLKEKFAAYYSTFIPGMKQML
jgi:hypothetical protein